MKRLLASLVLAGSMAGMIAGPALGASVIANLTPASQSKPYCQQVSWYGNWVVANPNNRLEIRFHYGDGSADQVWYTYGSWGTNWIHTYPNPGTSRYYYPWLRVTDLVTRNSSTSQVTVLSYQGYPC